MHVGTWSRVCWGAGHVRSVIAITAQKVTSDPIAPPSPPQRGGRVALRCAPAIRAWVAGDFPAAAAARQKGKPGRKLGPTAPGPWDATPPSAPEMPLLRFIRDTTPKITSCDMELCPQRGDTRSPGPYVRRVHILERQLREIRERMADQFLDTETDDQIPKIASLCNEAGLSITEARNIWRYEVTPAVWPNVWSITGEWAGWDAAWLAARIAEKRGLWPNRPGVLSWAVYRFRVHLLDRQWKAIERCMRGGAQRSGRSTPTSCR